MAHLRVSVLIVKEGGQRSRGVLVVDLFLL